MTMIKDVKTRTLSVHKARGLMGKNFLGIKQAKWHFGNDVFTESELKKLSETSFPENVLKECKDTHVLIAVPGKLSILDIQDKVDRELFNSRYEYFRHYNGKHFTKRRDKTCWRLVRKTRLPNARLKTWEEQKALLSSKQYIPDTRVMIYVIITYYLEKKLKLFGNHFIRTADACASPNSRVVIKNPRDNHGLSVLCWHNSVHVDGLGCAVARKLK